MKWDALRRGRYSLRRRMQLLAATSLLIAGFVLLTGTWVIDHILNHDLAREASIRVLRLLESNRNLALTPAEAKENEVHLEQILAKNPGAWYYYEDQDQIIRSAPEPPRHANALVGEIPQLFVEGIDTPLCDESGARFEFDSGDGVALVRYRGCGEEAYYIEVVGFTTLLSHLGHLWDMVQLQYFRPDSLKDTVLPMAVLTFLAIAAITLLFGRLMHGVQAVSGAAARIGKGKHHLSLPEENLPLEILPIVQAINRAITRLEAASEQQALFVAAAAHELRTPLTVFRTRLEELPESDSKDTLIEDLHRMNSMVSRLLALARLGTAEFDLDRLDLADVVHSTCMERGGVVFGQGKQLSFDSNSQAVEVLGDWESVKTAVTNLIDNALMFTPAGTAVRVGVDGNRVTVADEGPGVDVDDRERIFEPFFKKPPDKRGHGLGLAIVWEIMRIHEGSVETHNQPEGGAVFELTFQKAA